jgi:hypothetical protein
LFRGASVVRGTADTAVGAFVAVTLALWKECSSEHRGRTIWHSHSRYALAQSRQVEVYEYMSRPQATPLAPRERVNASRLAVRVWKMVSGRVTVLSPGASLVKGTE